MRTLADVKNSSKTAEIDLQDCVIVKEHKNGKFNIVCKLNNKKVYVNYVDLALCKDDKMYIQFGKKEDNWQAPHWYQIEAPEDENTEENTKKEGK